MALNFTEQNVHMAMYAKGRLCVIKYCISSVNSVLAMICPKSCSNSIEVETRSKVRVLIVPRTMFFLKFVLNHG